ncbi:MAG: CCA tRNA nucleotidyltransferase [Candidatus Peribacteraceae bacterium]|jgi:poly(A) polymerase
MALTKEIIAKTLATPMGERAYKVAETLFDAGFDTWWVGGAVRDMMLGTIPEDIDVATEALPEQICTLFKRCDRTHTAFGSVRVPAGKELFEVTTFREDDEASDGRHPESVVFGKREKDAKRRDFTFNAIYWHPISGELYDPFHGEDDLKEKIVRFIGDPAIRIKHDALRMFRAVRFRAQIDGQYHPETYRALQELAETVEILSGSRQLEEVEKMLRCAHPNRAYEDLWELRTLTFFLPELYAMKGIPQPADYHHEGDVWEHTMKCIASFRPEDDDDVRLATLFHDTGKVETFSLKERIRFDRHATISSEIAEKALRRLQCPGKRIEKVSWIIKHHMMMSTFGELTDERKAHWYFHPYFRDLLRLFELDIAGTDPGNYHLYDSILKDYHAFLDRHPRPKKPLLTGQDVMEILGLQPGERVGELLKRLHDAQIRGEVTTKEEARVFLGKQAP